MCANTMRKFITFHVLGHNKSDIWSLWKIKLAMEPS